MFGGGSVNPYDDIVGKTTDENLTSENWELILNLCDKVSDEGQEGARNVIAAILKRLAHRNPNVQLYALALTESLSKNCGVVMNREIASRAFTQGLEKLITDRNSHDKVKKRALALIVTWTAEFENDPTLGIMEECFNNLKGKGHKFEVPQEPLPPSVDDEIRRKEEEELQRVLELSMQDKGGRGQWSQYSLAASSSSSAPSSQPAQSSASAITATRPSSSSHVTKAPSRTSSLAHKQQPPTYQGGYAPARSPSPPAAVAPQSSPPPQQQQPQPQHRQSLSVHQHSSPSIASHQQQQPATPIVTSTSPTPSLTAVSSSASALYGTGVAPSAAIVTRVRALHTFEPTEPGELAFEKGDIIRVVDRGYKDWWRGQLKGRTGIFPVNYVEPMPEPTAVELGKEAEQEASVFAQAVNVEKLLNMLRSFDSAKDNLADNEEIQELYRSCMALRPKIVKLIDKYSQKRADLVSMNETFIRARAIFDRMMEESLAKHSAYYEHTYPYGGPDPRARVGSPIASGPQQYGWNPSLYDQSGYGPYPPQGPPYPAQHEPPAQYTSPIQNPGYPAQPNPHDAAAYAASTTPAPASTPGAAYNEPSTYVRTPQGQVQVHAYSPPGTYHAPAQMGAAGVPYGATPYPAQAAAQPQSQPVPAQAQAQAQVHPQPQTQPQVQPQPQPQPQAQAYHQEYQTQEYPPQGGQVPSQGYHAEYHGHPQQQQQQPAQAQGAQVPQGYHASEYQQQQQQPAQVQGAQVPQGYHADYQSLPQQQQQPAQSPVIQTLQPTIISQQSVSQHQPQAQPQPQVRHMSTDSITAGQAEAQAQQLAQGPMETQDQPQAQQSQAAQGSQSETSGQQAQMQAAGPPYVFDPQTTYSDPNVQAWAHYYAQGGKDTAGAVYFFSVPGVTDGAPQPQPQPAQAQSQHYQSQSQYQQHQSNAGSSASIGSNGAQGDISTSSSPEQSFQLHASEQQQQAAAGTNYAYSAGAQPLSKASYSSLTSVTALPAATAGTTAGQIQNQGSAATHTPSWVIPKKNAGSGLSTATSQPGSPTLQATAPAVGIGGGYGAPDPAAGGGGGGGQPYYSLPNQFATLSVADQQQHH
ncbi:hypothetical protein F5887DRAFT_1203636 [Amanita rubescens]|nr:hypothetical protein F5887DRAFT_1203636 [Amanita rubescens]